MYRQFEHLCRVYADLEGRGLLGWFQSKGNGRALSQRRPRKPPAGSRASLHRSNGLAFHQEALAALDGAGECTHSA